jgi:hypothetical protein
LIGIALLLALTPSSLLSLFLQPSITGHAVSTQVGVEGPEINSTCNMTLQQGWNMIAIGCFTSDTTLSTMLSSINGKYASIMGYYPDYGDKWRTYNPSLPSWVVQDLANISRKNSYWLYLKNTTNFTTSGTLKLMDYISVERGWNFVSNPTNKTYNISRAFATIDGKYSIVHSYDRSLGVWQSYVPNGNNSNASGLKNFTPSRGYWVNMTEGGVIFLWDI